MRFWISTLLVGWCSQAIAADIALTCTFERQYDLEYHKEYYFYDTISLVIHITNEKTVQATSKECSLQGTASELQIDMRCDYIEIHFDIKRPASEHFVIDRMTGAVQEYYTFGTIPLLYEGKCKAAKPAF